MGVSCGWATRNFGERIAYAVRGAGILLRPGKLNAESRLRLVRIPLKVISDSGGKPITIPEGNRSRFRKETDQASERSDAGSSTLPKLIGMVKLNLSGAKRR